jgi:pimeloyl-ACP methyl ester carboxylesterase
MTTMTEPTTQTLAVDAGSLTFDVRPATTGPSTGSPAPPLMMIGSPMGAGGFATLASYFAERTVVTYDPRGVERSVKDDPATESTPQQHADDLHRIIAEIGSGPVDLFASSGGAVNALALVAAHPDDVRTLVAHEPPLAAILSDRDGALAASRAIADAYPQDGFGAGMARFISVVSHDGPFDPAGADQPGPDPAMFGLPTEDDGSRTDPLLYQNIISCTHYEPDFDALRAAPTRVVPAFGSESGQTLAARGARTAAERLGVDAVAFPSDHGGFMGGEYGQAGDPEAFAAKLHEVLDQG